MMTLTFQLADMLLFALYAFTTVLLVVWARRSANAASRSASAAEDSAQAAKRSAGASERSAAAAESQAQLARESLEVQIAQLQGERMQAQPLLVRSGGSGKGGVLHNFLIENKGAPVTGVRLLTTQGQLRLEVGSQSLLEKGGTLRVDIQTPAAGWFEIGYVDRYQQAGSIWFYFDGKRRIIAREVGQPPVPESKLAEWVASRSA